MLVVKLLIAIYQVIELEIDKLGKLTALVSLWSKHLNH